MNHPVVSLMGPTASGKTAFAIELIKSLPLEIISVDSALIYRGMDIGTAKPTPQELKEAPHHLIDIRNPNERYSASEFCEEVNSLIQAIHQRGRVPLLVGGTMMYFRALQQGLNDMPATDEKIREKISKKLANLGIEQLYEQLKKVDPLRASNLHQNDTQRILRALEVFEITGKPLSHHYTETQKSQYNFLNLGLFPEDRAWLHNNIQLRFEKILALGLIEEVKELIQNWQLDLSHMSLKSVGYRQAYLYLTGEIESIEAFKDKGVAATRQLAKRQITWLRSWPELIKIDPKSESAYLQLYENIKEFINLSK